MCGPKFCAYKVSQDVNELMDIDLMASVSAKVDEKQTAAAGA